MNPLTDLPNRRLFTERLKLAIAVLEQLDHGGPEVPGHLGIGQGAVKGAVGGERTMMDQGGEFVVSGLGEEPSRLTSKIKKTSSRQS